MSNNADKLFDTIRIAYDPTVITDRRTTEETLPVTNTFQELNVRTGTDITTNPTYIDSGIHQRNELRVARPLRGNTNTMILNTLFEDNTLDDIIEACAGKDMKEGVVEFSSTNYLRIGGTENFGSSTTNARIEDNGRTIVIENQIAGITAPNAALTALEEGDICVIDMESFDLIDTGSDALTAVILAQREAGEAAATFNNRDVTITRTDRKFRERYCKVHNTDTRVDGENTFTQLKLSLLPMRKDPAGDSSRNYPRAVDHDSDDLVAFDTSTRIGAYRVGTTTVDVTFNTANLRLSGGRIKYKLLNKGNDNNGLNMAISRGISDITFRSLRNVQHELFINTKITQISWVVGEDVLEFIANGTPLGYEFRQPPLATASVSDPAIEEGDLLLAVEPSLASGNITVLASAGRVLFYVDDLYQEGKILNNINIALNRNPQEIPQAGQTAPGAVRTRKFDTTINFSSVQEGADPIIKKANTGETGSVTYVQAYKGVNRLSGESTADDLGTGGDDKLFIMVLPKVQFEYTREAQGEDEVISYNGVITSLQPDTVTDANRDVNTIGQFSVSNFLLSLI